MADKLPTTPVRGTRDLLPAECALRDEALAAILRVYRSWGFARIETPALEHLELLTGGQGGENEKLIFKLMKRGEKLDLSKPGLTEDDVADCGLRYDLTVPLARYYAEHQAELPLPFKAIQVGPVWRAERPQKGRYRQFTQCDIDVIGEPGVQAEIGLILATTEALAAVGLSGFTVRLNDRRVFEDIANYCGIAQSQRDAFLIAWDKLDKVGREGVLSELREIGIGPDARGRVDRILRLPDGTSVLLEVKASASPEAYATALQQLAKYVGRATGQSVRVVVDTNLVRGMGYYTGPVFEISVDGLPYSIAGGGRYDKMIGRLVGRDVPACGFSIGFERLILLLQERGWRPEGMPRRIALIFDESVPFDLVLERALALRVDGAVVSLFAQKKKAGKQRADLEAQGFEIESLAARGGGAE
jgi:histidyl-tRNA synthetase